jgi:hypothetical protein
MRRGLVIAALALGWAGCADGGSGDGDDGWAIVGDAAFLDVGDAGDVGADGSTADAAGPDPDATADVPIEEIVEDVTDPTDPTTFINEGWIGGLCSSDADCTYTAGFCFTDDEGFPDGMCSMPCDLYCPDEDGMVMTFCIGAGSVDVDAPPGLCTTRCDYGASETGCRPGYQCALLPRHNDPATVLEACIPEGIEPAAPIDPTNCQDQLFELGVSFTPASNPMATPDGHPELVCDIQDPVMVTGVIHGVNFRYSKTDAEPKAMFASCPLALSLEKMAKLLSEKGVSDVIHWGTYNCRVISGTHKLSQHGLANAIDIRGLVTASGDYYEVLSDWEFADFPTTEAGSFLKWFAETLYIDWIFNIILTPNHNSAHADHFHLDLTPDAHSLN